jgi:predicted amidohydrolase
LPENFSFLGDEHEKLAQAEAIASASEKFLKTMAQRFQVTLLGGGFPVPVGNGKVYNTALLIDPSGAELARYEKVHLFDVNVPDGNTYQESGTVLAGIQLPPMHPSKELGNLGLSVCYDVRFPELYRHLAQMGAEVLFVPAAFTGVYRQGSLAGATASAGDRKHVLRPGSRPNRDDITPCAKPTDMRW